MTCIRPADPRLDQLAVQTDAVPARVLRELAPLVAATARSDRATQVWLHDIAAQAYRSMGREADRRREADLAMAIAQDPGSPAYAVAAIQWAVTRPTVADTGIAVRALQRLATRHQPNDPVAICLSGYIGFLQAMSGDHANGLKTSATAYRRAVLSGDPALRVAIAERMRFVSQFIEDHHQADAYNREVLDWAREEKLPALEGITLYSIGLSAQARGHTDRAITDLRQARALMSRPDINARMGNIDTVLCDLMVSRRLYHRAEPVCRRAYEILHPQSDRDADKVLLRIAQIGLAQGRLQPASRLIDDIAVKPLRAGLAERLDQALEMRAALRRQQGDFRGAAEDLTRVLARQQARARQQKQQEVNRLKVRFAAQHERLHTLTLERDLALQRVEQQKARTRLWMLGLAILALIVLTVVIVIVGRRHRRRLERNADQARELAENKAELLSMMSHEIRGPLGSILLTAENLAFTADLSEANHRAVQRLNRDSDRLMTLLDDLLLLSRIEAKQMPVRVERFAPRRLLEDIVDSLAEQADRASMALSVAIAPDVPEILIGDPGKIAQIFHNLLLNAILHSRARHVTAIWAPQDRQYRLAVSDDGCGIAPAEHPRLFHRFSQGKQGLSGKTGTGLGLSICKGLAQLMGGRIALDSILGRGTTIDVLLPLDTPSADHRRYGTDGPTGTPSPMAAMQF